MAWKVLGTAEFEEWLLGSPENIQRAVDFSVRLLEEKGPTLDHPYSSSISGSKFGSMRELRMKAGGRACRVFYIFDPKRRAILLIGGIKTDNKNWYRKYIAKADAIYEAVLRSGGFGHD